MRAPWRGGFRDEEYMTLARYPEGISASHRAQSLEPNALLNNYRLGEDYLIQNMPGRRKSSFSMP